MKKLLALLCTATALSGHVAAADIGTIEKISMAGPNDPNHPNVVQLKFTEPVITVPGCSTTYTAIRVQADTEHLISLAMSAAMTSTPVEVRIDGNDKYTTDRCAIYTIGLFPN